MSANQRGGAFDIRRVAIPTAGIHIDFIDSSWIRFRNADGANVIRVYTTKKAFDDNSDYAELLAAGGGAESIIEGPFRARPARRASLETAELAAAVGNILVQRIWFRSAGGGEATLEVTIGTRI